MLETTEMQLDAWSILNAAPDNYLILLPDAPKFTIVGVTDAFLSVTDSSRKNLLGKGLFEAFADSLENAAPTRAMNLTASLHHVITHKKEHHMEPQWYNTFNAATGAFELKMWQSLNKPVLNKNGHIDYIIHGVEDITQKVQLEATEQAAREKLEKGDTDLQKKVAERTAELQHQQLFIGSILDASFNGIYALETVYDKEGALVDFRYLFVNGVIASIVGLPARDIIGKTILELIPENKTNGFFDLFCSVLQKGESVREETYFTTEKFTGWFDYAVVPINENSLVVTLQDITEYKKSLHQIEQQRNLLEKYVEDLRRSNANLEEFAYAASHDLKEPIRKIHFFSDRLKYELEDKLDDNQRRLFNRMENAAQRMGLLIDDLLTYSHVSKGVSHLEEIDLNQKVQKVLEDLELEVQQKEALITVGPLPAITGHRRHLQQLFQNLISNALKYSKPGTPPQVHISSRLVSGKDIPLNLSEEESRKSYHLIEVRDNGIGFDPSDAERIFNMFTRLHGNTEYRGTGIGLSIARKVMENHGGYIWGESQPGEGATFKMLFPVGTN